MKNYYEILEVNPKASDGIIKKIYKIKVKLNHPDLFQGDDKAKAEEITKEITEAYDILSNKEKRNEYDLILKNNENENLYNKYDNIITNLKSENEYLKQVIASKNNMINSFVHNELDDIYEETSRQENQSYQIPHINKFHNNENYTKNYSNSMIFELKQILFRFAVFFVLLLSLLMLLWLFTGNSIFKVIKDIL